MIVPWNGEHYAAIAGMRHHDGAVAREKPAVENEVHALAQGHHGLRGWVRLAPQVIAECAGRVNHHLRLRPKLLAGFDVAYVYAIHKPVAVLRQAGDGGVVQQRGAMLGTRSGQGW